ncbi:MAG: T9SS type A sorting domain-containing protein, partial [Bacteroidetes bacterium]|nr:T9SS type A sorting domain-containing protein [Bacteroidota bacterium]
GFLTPLTAEAQDDPIPVTLPAEVIGTEEIGETVLLPVELGETIDDVLSVQFEVLFDASIADVVGFTREGTALANPSGSSDWSVVTNTGNVGEATISATRSNSITLTAGTLVFLEVVPAVRGRTDLTFSTDTSLEIAQSGGAVDTEGIAGEVTVNNPPEVVDTIDDQLLQSDEAPATFDLPSVFSNPLGDDLLFEATAGTPGVVSLDVTAGTLTVTPEASGSTAVGVTATDEIGDEATTSFVVTVNTPPIADGIPDFTDESPVTIGVPETIALDAFFSDPDGEGLTYTATSDNADAITATLDGATLTLDALAAGTATITVTAEDAQGGTVEDSFTAEVNQPPVVEDAVADQLLQTTDEPFAVDVAAVFSDPDGDALAFAATSADADVATVTLADGTATITPIASGETTLTLTADDERGGLTDESFTVTVNTPPIVDTPIVDLTGDMPVTVGTPETIDLDTVFSDPDGETLAYAASSDNADAITATVEGATLTLDALAAGTATITVTAEDAQGGTVADSFRAEVNQRPVVELPLEDIPLDAGDPPVTRDLGPVFTDPDDGALTFSATSANEDLVSVSVVGETLTIEAVGEGDGSVAVTVSAADGRGGLTETTVNVVFNIPPPIAEEIGDQVLLLGDAPLTLNLSRFFTDEDGDPISSFEVASDDAAVASVALVGTELELTPVGTGTTAVSITAISGRGGTTTQTFAVTVIDYPDTVEATITRGFDDATNASNYRLVAIPGATPLGLASTLEGTAGTQWRAFWDDGSDEDFLREYEAGSDLFDFVPGRGFWVLSQNDWSVTDTRPTVALQNGTFSFDVHEGWNIISNPFDADVDWDLVQAASDVELLELWRWDGSGGWGTPVDTLASAGTGEAFYVRAETAGTVTLPYPTSQQAADLRAALDAAPAATPDDVRQLVLDGTLEDTGATTRVVAALGTAERAAHSPMPRASFADLQLQLQTEDAPPLYRQRQADDGTGVSFTVEVAVSPIDEMQRAVVLAPENLDAFAHTNVHLVDTATSEAYDLHREGPVRLRFEGEQTRRTLRLLIGPTAFVEEALRQETPDALTLKPNYPNPFAASTTLQFTLPEATDVHLAVYDLLGREVGVLAEGYLAAGLHEVTWDAQTATGTPAGSGVYIARLRAGSTTHTERLVLVR